jgi:hypothetical protein
MIALVTVALATGRPVRYAPCAMPLILILIRFQAVTITVAQGTSAARFICSIRCLRNR